MVEFKKLRLYFAWVFAFLIVFFAKTTNSGFVWGIPVILAGETLRIWAQGTIRKRVQLATSGPYSYTRNPLYLSNFLIGLGFVMILSNIWLILIYMIGFYILYSGTIREEEQFLSGKYGTLYKEYCAHVPRFWPSARAYQQSSDSFDWKLAHQHGEEVTFASILLILLGLFLRQEWYQNENGFYSTQLPFFWLFIFIFVGLIFLMVKRKLK